MEASLFAKISSSRPVEKLVSMASDPLIEPASYMVIIFVLFASPFESLRTTTFQSQLP